MLCALDNVTVFACMSVVDGSVLFESNKVWDFVLANVYVFLVKLDEVCLEKNQDTS